MRKTKEKTAVLGPRCGNDPAAIRPLCSPGALAWAVTACLQTPAAAGWPTSGVPASAPSSTCSFWSGATRSSSPASSPPHAPRRRGTTRYTPHPEAPLHIGPLRWPSPNTSPIPSSEGGGGGQPQGGGGAWAAKTVKRPPQQPAQPPVRQLLGAADAQTAPATFSTAPAHQRRGTANAETTPAGAPAAAADRTQRPDATCEGKNG